jgi:hypothetical protein
LDDLFGPTGSKADGTESLRRLFRDPVFHETTVILVPLGPSVFKKHNFFDYDWLLFRLFGLSLCYVLYVIFITFFEKNLGKRPAVEPSIF